MVLSPEQALLMADNLALPEEVKEFKPHPGPQEQFLSTPADIAFYGGAAGGGKTTALLWEAGRHTHVPGYTAVIFRRTSPEITNPGGLADESTEYYPALKGIPKNNAQEWHWRWSGSTVRFAAMQHEQDRYKWQGSQLCFIAFDEVTHFSMTQFFYMMSRNRSGCGVRPYIRATCNPDPDSWVREFIDWWIDAEGFPIPERSGVIRYFARVNNEIIWASTKKELTNKGMRPKSFTFILSKLTDNPTLMKNDPDYIANLEALPAHERARLLGGNWDARAMEGDYFQKSWFPIVDAAPAGGRSVRWWDRAATEPSESNPNPDYTVGLKLTEYRGVYYIEDVVRFRGNPLRVERTIQNTTAQDGKHVKVLLPQDPGAAGKTEVAYLVKTLAGSDIQITNERSGNKATRAVPVSSQANAGNIVVVRGKWNQAFFNEAESFTGEDGKKDDQIDSLSGAYNYFTNEESYRIR